MLEEIGDKERDVDRRSDLEISVEEVEPRQLRLTVEVPEERVQGEMRRLARVVARQITIPGFRKGRAPYRIVAQRYGEELLREDAAESLAETVYREALESEGIAPYGPATLERVDLSPLRYTFTVPLEPEVDLGDYRSLRIKQKAVRVTKKEVQEALKRLREEHAVLEPVEGRAAEPGDVIVFSMEGRTETGEPFLGRDEVEMVLDPDDERPLPGFHRNLLGVRPGEERTFRLKAPEDWSFQEAEFTVKVDGVFQRVLPEVDDDLARTVGPFESLDELRKHVRERLQEEKRREAEEEYLEQAIAALLEGAKVRYPPQAVDEEIDELVEELAERVGRGLRMSLEDYLKVTGQTEAGLREELRERAEERLRNALVFSEFVRAEGLQVTEEEVEQRIAEIRSAREDQGGGWTPTDEERQRLASSLLQEKIVARLTAIARGEVGEEGENA